MSRSPAHRPPVRTHRGRTSLRLLALAAMLLAVQASSQVAPRERAQALLREGAIHLDGGDAQAAESLLRQASLLDPGNALIWSHLGSALMAQRRFPEAADTFRESLRLDRSSPALGLKLKRQTLDGLGLSLAFQGALREAADLYTAVVAEDPGYPSFSYNLACVLTLDGRTQEAVQALVWALDADARSPAGATLPDPALDDDLKGLRGTPRFQAALLMHLPPQPDDGPSSATMREGAGLLARGRYAEAAAKERSAAALDGADPRCWFFLGGALLETGSTGEACEALLRSLLEDRKASRLPPAAVRFAGLRSGTWLMDQGRHEEAGLALQRAHEAAPNHPWPHYLLARLYATAGRPKEALDSLGRALRHGENLSPGEPLLPDPRTDPSFSALSGDPGWASVVPPAGPQGAAVP